MFFFVAILTSPNGNEMGETGGRQQKEGTPFQGPLV